MTPSQVSQALRHIATKIENSAKPDRTLVARDLRGLLTKIAEECGPGAPMVSQQEQEAMPSSGVGKQILGEALKAAQEALAKGDQEALKKAVENINRAHR